MTNSGIFRRALRFFFVLMASITSQSSFEGNLLVLIAFERFLLNKKE
jgi:hypothetical protein